MTINILIIYLCFHYGLERFVKEGRGGKLLKKWEKETMRYIFKIIFFKLN